MQSKFKHSYILIFDSAIFDLRRNIMSKGFKQLRLRVNDDMYEKITNIAKKSDESISYVMRELLEKGLANEWVNENTDLITGIVKEK